MFLRKQNAWPTKSVKGVPCEGLDSLYVRDQLVALVQMLNTKTWMQKLLLEVLNLCIPQRQEQEEGTWEENASFCCQPGCQRRQLSHSVPQLVTESLLSSAFLLTFSNAHCHCGEKGRLVLALHMWHDLRLQPGTVSTCFRKLILLFQDVASEQCLKIRTVVKCVTL